MGESYSGIRVLVDFVRDVTKYQQAFWRRCRRTVATLSTDSAILVSSSFLFLSFYLLLIECMLRVAFDPSLRLWIEKDNLGQG